MKWSHFLVSTMYGVIQLLINFSIIYWKLNFVEGILYLIFPTLIMYVLAKFYIFKNDRDIIILKIYKDKNSILKKNTRIKLINN